MENRNFIVASHNSWSYMPERKKWMRLVRPIARCQDKTIAQQYYDNVRYFDLRLRWDEKEEDFVLAHGIVTYIGRYYYDLLWLDEQAYKNAEKICIRVLLEDSGKANRMIDDKFHKKCRDLQKRFSFLTFTGGSPVRKRWGKVIYDFKSDAPDVKEYHVSVSGKWWQFIPYLWAKRNNHKALENARSYLTMLDFV